MGTLGIEFLDEGVEFGPLLEDVGAGGPGGVLLQGKVHAFVAAILLGVARANSLDGNAEAQPPHESFERLNKPFGEANGTPLSERIARGKPRSLNKRSKAVTASFSWFDSIASHNSRYREA
jgi:hypothetical protein